MRRIAVLLAGLALVAMLLAACGGDDALTVAEYAEWCGDNPIADEIDLESAATWREFVGLLERVRSEAQSVTPPDEIREYHASTLAVLDAMIGFGQRQDEDAVPDLFSAALALIPLAATVDQATGSLDVETRATLAEAGCLDDEAGLDQSLSGGAGSTVNVDRSDPAAVGERVTVERPMAGDSFELIVRGQPESYRATWRLPVTVISLEEEWSYGSSLWASDQMQLVTAPDRDGRLYRLSEAVFTVDDMGCESLAGVVLVRGGRFEGCLYFEWLEEPAGVEFAELRYPSGRTMRVVELSAGDRRGRR